MRIFVDADSILQSFRNIILKRAAKDNIETFFVADRSLSDVLLFRDKHSAILRDPYRKTLPKEELRKIKSNINMIVVPVSKDSADDYIISKLMENDILISHDIPLCERGVNKKAIVLDDRGNMYDEDNIRQRLSERNMMQEFREMGIFSEKQSAMDDKLKLKFANAFDKAISIIKN